MAKRTNEELQRLDAAIRVALQARPAGIMTYVVRNILEREHGFPGIDTPTIRRRLLRMQRAGEVSINFRGPGCHTEWRVLERGAF